MEVIFTGYNTKIAKEGEKYFLTFDEGRLTIKYRTIEISKEDAKRAQESAEESLKVITEFQNREKGLI